MGVVFRQVPCSPGATHSFAAGKKIRINLGCSRHLWPRTAFGYGDLECHRVMPRCGGKESLRAMKKLKLLKGLLCDEFVSGSGAVGSVEEKMVSEAADVLIKQVQEVRIKHKELKKKAKMKSRRMKDESSSSSSSSSSDNEDEDEDEDNGMMSMSQVRNNPLIEQPPTVSEKEDHKTYVSSGSNIRLVERNRSVSKAKRIEVCMGKKCKKLGGAALLDEFEKVMGEEGGVVGRKCMGKCRDGPNVRVVNNATQGGMVDDDDDSLCTGVGLQEVALIVANFVHQN